MISSTNSSFLLFFFLLPARLHLVLQVDAHPLTLHVDHHEGHTFLVFFRPCLPFLALDCITRCATLPSPSVSMYGVIVILDSRK